MTTSVVLLRVDKVINAVYVLRSRLAWKWVILRLMLHQDTVQTMLKSGNSRLTWESMTSIVGLFFMQISMEIWLDGFDAARIFGNRPPGESCCLREQFVWLCLHHQLQQSSWCPDFHPPAAVAWQADRPGTSNLVPFSVNQYLNFSVGSIVSGPLQPDAG